MNRAVHPDDLAAAAEVDERLAEHRAEFGDELTRDDYDDLIGELRAELVALVGVEELERQRDELDEERRRRGPAAGVVSIGGRFFEVYWSIILERVRARREAHAAMTALLALLVGPAPVAELGEFEPVENLAADRCDRMSPLGDRSPPRAFHMNRLAGNAAA